MTSPIRHAVAIASDLGGRRFGFARLRFHESFETLLVAGDERSAVLIRAPTPAGNVGLTPAVHIDLRLVCSVAVSSVGLLDHQRNAHPATRDHHQPQPY